MKMAFDLALRAIAAEEAISSCEIENGKMQPEKRFRLKMSVMFPDMKEKDLDAMEAFYLKDHLNGA